MQARITNARNNEIIWQHKKNNGQNKKRRKTAEVASVQCNLLDYQNRQKSEVLYPFAPNKSYVYLLNVE